MDSNIFKLLKNGGIYEDDEREICFMVDEDKIEWTGSRKIKYTSDEVLQTIFLFESQTEEVKRFIYHEKCYDTFSQELKDDFYLGKMDYISLHFDGLYYERHYNFSEKKLYTSFSYSSKRLVNESDGIYFSRLFSRLMKDFYGGHELNLRKNLC